MEDVLQWCESDANDEYFYVEEEEVRDGKLLVSVAGRYSFFVHLETFEVTCKDQRAPVKEWTAKMHGDTFGNVIDVLTKATAHYKDISDALDALDEEGMEDSDDDDHGDLLIAEEPPSSRKSPEQIEQERRFEEFLKTVKIKSTGTQAATDRILSDYKSIFLSRNRHGWDATPHASDLYKWDIRLFDFEKGTPLHADVQKLKQQRGKDYIEMLLTFPPDYPFKPPFLRIIRPKFKFRSGRVTIGGSICHELLTTKGWKPVNDIESIIETIRCEITDPEAEARLDLTATEDYQEVEAKAAFERTAERYGWN